MEWNDPVMIDGEAQSIFRSVDSPAVVAKEPVFTTDQGAVTLQVYELGPWSMQAGLPLFHVGVEVYNEERFYTTGGIDVCVPGGYFRRGHREAIPLGRTHFSRIEVLHVILGMQEEWLPGGYVSIGCNCQDFALAFCKALGVHESIPRECLYFANMSDVLPPLVIAGIREADKRITSMQKLLTTWGSTKVADTEGERASNSTPCRLGTISSANGLPPVVLPLETEATVTP